MKYAFIKQHQQQHAVAQLCRVLAVSRSGFYDWVCRAESDRAKRHRCLSQQIKIFFEESHQTYGAVRICRDLREAGHRVGKNTVALLMRRVGLLPKTLRRFRITTDSRNTKAMPNLLAQQFSTDKPNHRWVSDMTFIPTRQGWLYLAVVLDLFSRACIGWSMSERMKSSLALDALNMAVLRRSPTQPVLVHSDRGSQYGADDYQQRLKANGMIASMSRKGHCWDNAVAESFFHTLKTELTHHQLYQSRLEAKESVFKYIEVFYNRKRRHSFLNYQAPMVYEVNYQNP